MRIGWPSCLALVTLALPAEAAVMELRGGLGMIELVGVDLPVEEGDEAIVTISYDETQMEDESSVDDPQHGFFPDAILAARLEVPAAGIDFGFVPDRFGSISLTDDGGSAPALIDTIIWNVAGEEDPLALSLDPVLALVVTVTDTRLTPPAPDLLEDANALPDPALDLDSPGILTAAFTVGFQSLATFTAVLGEPVATAVPEPHGSPSAAAVLTTLTVLAVRRRRHE